MRSPDPTKATRADEGRREIASQGRGRQPYRKTPLVRGDTSATKADEGNDDDPHSGAALLTAARPSSSATEPTARVRAALLRYVERGRRHDA